MAKETLGMAIELTANVSNFNEQLRKARAEVQSLTTQFSNYSKAAKLDPSNLNNYSTALERLKSKQQSYQNIVTTLKAKIETLNSANEGQKRIIQELESVQSRCKEKVESLTEAYGKNSPIVQGAQAAYEKLGTQIDEAKSHQVNLEKEIDKSNTQLENAQSQLAKTDAELKNYAEGADDAKEKSMAFQVALGELTAKAIQEAIEGLKNLVTNVIETGSALEDATAGLAAVLQESKDSETIKDLSSYFQELAASSTSSATEITKYATVLANAGYSSDQIKDSISSINDLAVGTGESFEEMANIVVDGLAAFGMASDEADHFANVLAKSAISSNTNVSMMGEAFKYVGSVAGQFGYSVEDVGVALGTMANQGIKASTAGTSLRSMITRLATNTSHARDTIENLGISFYDADGQARPLSQIFSEMREKMKDMTDEQKANIEYTVAGQRAMTGLAAILGASDESWNQLTEDVNNYNGTIEGMAETKLDTYSGQVALLKHEWEAVASELFQEVEPALKDIISSLKDVVKSEAFKGTLKVAVKGLSAVFKSLAKVIETIGPSGTVAAAGIGSIVTAVKGVSKAKELIGGFNAVLKQASTEAKTASDSTNLLSKSISVAGGGFSKLASGLGVSTGTLALFTAGAVAAGAATIYLADTMQKSNEAYIENLNSSYGLSTAMKRNVEEIGNLKESYDDAIETTNLNVQAVEKLYANYGTLAERYDELIDSNGNIKQGYEDEANTIMTSLAQALGMEKDQLAEIVKEHGNMTSAIKAEMEVKKANAMLNAYEEQYSEAVKNSQTALADKLQAQQAFDEQLPVTQQAQENLRLAVAKYNAEMENSGQVQQSTKDAMSQAMAEYETAKYTLDNLSDAVTTADDTYNSYQNTIKNYEGVSSAIVEGDAAKISASLDNLTNNFQYAGNASVDALKKQVEDAQTQYDLLLEAQKNNDSSVTNEMVTAAQDRLERAKEEYSKAEDLAEESGRQVGEKYGENEIEGIESKEPTYYATGKKSTKKVKEGAESISLRESGIWSALGFIKGIISKYGDAYDAGAGLGKQSKAGTNGYMVINSPSKVMEESGEWTGEGYVKGVENKFKAVRNVGAQMAAVMKDSLNDTVRENLVSTAQAPSNTSNTYNNYSSTPNVSITIVQREGEDSDALARRVAQLIDSDASRRSKAWQ